MINPDYQRKPEITKPKRISMRIKVEEDDTYNIYQIAGMENLKDRIIDDLKTTIEMIQNIDSTLNTEKQSYFLSRILQINIAGMNQKTYDSTKDIRDFFMHDVDGWYESLFKQFIYHHRYE